MGRDALSVGEVSTRKNNMTQILNKADAVILTCNVLKGIFGLLGAAGCFMEGHPYLSTGFLAIAAAANEVKDFIIKKQSNVSSSATN
jgi:hypothetical protein